MPFWIQKDVCLTHSSEVVQNDYDFWLICNQRLKTWNKMLLWDLKVLPLADFIFCNFNLIKLKLRSFEEW